MKQSRSIVEWIAIVIVMAGTVYNVISNYAVKENELKHINQALIENKQDHDVIRGNIQDIYKLLIGK